MMMTMNTRAGISVPLRSALFPFFIIVAVLVGNANASSQGLRATNNGQGNEQDHGHGESQLIQVKLPNGDGIVEGVALPDENAKFWKGIPYAASTAGKNRFRPPQKRSPWNGVWNATVFGPGCPQTHHNADVPKNQSEDCLNLNVYTPAADPPKEGWPVMIFFHGGAFLEGSNQGPFGIYEGNTMAASGDVVVVTSNYRLGAYGYVVTDNIPGNQGFLDQRMALEWVQDNIAAFGGNASRVTVWGESAGAMSVGLHMISPGSKGLFHQGIMESNPSAFWYKNEKEAAYYGLKFCSVLQCNISSSNAQNVDARKKGLHPSSAPQLIQMLHGFSTYNDEDYLSEEELALIVSESSCSIPCIQNATVKDVNEAWEKASDSVWTFIEANWRHLLGGFLQFTPTVDGNVIPQEPLQAVEQGNFTDVPVLLGTNRNEGATFIYAALDNSLPSFLAPIAYDVLFGFNNSKEIASKPRYSPDSSDDARVIFSHMATDYLFRCSSEVFPTALIKKNVNSYMYRFSHIFSHSSIYHKFGLPDICVTEVCHASELPFVFHNDVPQVNGTFTHAEANFSAFMQTYWTNFVTNGDPNKGRSVPLKWPLWDPQQRQNIGFGNGSDVNFYIESSKEMCEFWDGIGYFH